MSEQQQQQQSTPPPAANDGSPNVGVGVGGPTPQMIGIRFVKTYYQVLSSTPAQIFKFYKPSSVLSHGEGSTPTSAVDFEKYDLKVRWGEAQRFDFDNGAIDAQPSSDGSILLVVTGHVVVKTEDGKEERKGFVHTFYLALVSLPNKQKTYYVKNDILRFLKPDVPSATDAAVPSAPSPEPVAAAVTPEPAMEEPEQPVEEPAVVVEEEPVVKEEKKEEEVPAAKVVEEKTEAPAEKPKVEKEPAPAAEEKPKETKEPPAKETTTEPKKKEGKGKRQRGRGKSPQNAAAKQQPASKPAPGSWASLVASGSGPATTPAPQASSTPSKPPAPEKKTETPSSKSSSATTQKKEEKSDAPNTKENGKAGNKDKPKRDPDNTLVIKNLPDGTKEAELLAIFEQFAVQTNAKIVSSTISSHRGLAFVDYDSVAPVMKAVEQHGKEPIQLNGKVLEVDQKTAEQRARKARGGYRSGSPNQNNNNRGGGRQNKRNNGGRGGKGNRGGGGGGGGNNSGKDGGGGGGR